MLTKKVVINKCFGGFGLSLKALDLLADLKGHGKLFHYLKVYGELYFRKITAEEADKDFGLSLDLYTFTKDVGDSFPGDDLYSHFEKHKYSPEIERHDRELIKVIETLGSDAAGKFSRLEIVEIPKEVDYQIEEYDGNEWIAERHFTWS